jgi:geranylgeranyl diphosphate synthase type II
MQAVEKIDLEHYLLTKGKMVTECLNRLIPEKKVSYNQLFCAARYSLMSGGKRIRPILALAVCECLNGSEQLAIEPVCALEMIHTYSMIHDDLPCMDNDDYRRGIPTLHKAFPEGHALLAGDFLLTHAFGILARSEGLTAEQRVQLINLLATSTGGDGMIAGQVMDIEAENKSVDIEYLRQIHNCKTGALIEASIEFGAIIAGAKENEIALLRIFGKNIGLAFQIVDDILDVTSSTNKHGKSVASDITNGKKTYVSLLGLEASKDTARQLLNTALENLKKLSFDTLLLSELAKFIVHRNI